MILEMSIIAFLVLFCMCVGTILLFAFIGLMRNRHCDKCEKKLFFWNYGDKGSMGSEGINHYCRKCLGDFVK